MSKYSKLCRIYSDQKLELEQILTLTGNKFNHIKSVLRMHTKQNFRIFNENSGEYLAEIIGFTRQKLRIKINKKLREISNDSELILAMSLIKPDKFIQAVRAAVQLGITTIIPVIATNTQFAEINHERVMKCILETVEQCERIIPPKLASISNLEELLSNTTINQIVWCDECSDLESKISDLQLAEDGVAVLIGAEGGFTDEERQVLQSSDKVYSITLGKNVLRSEIAAIAAIACLQMERL